MNRQQLIINAQKAIDERRFKAEENCELRLTSLRQNDDYKSCERALRRAQLAQDKEAIKKYKEQLHSILESNNYTEADLKPNYSCPNCGDTG